MHTVKQSNSLAFMGLHAAAQEYIAQREAEELTMLRPYAYTPTGKCKNHYAAMGCPVHVTNVRTLTLGRRDVVSTYFVYPAH